MILLYCKMLNLFVVGVTLFHINVCNAQKNACTISFPKQNDQDEPILLTVNDEDGYELAIPEKGRFSLEASENLVLFCPNARNSLTSVKNNMATASCVRNQVFRVSNQQYEFDELRCQKPVKGEIKASNTRCANNEGKIIDIGFQVTSSNWIPLIKVCYDAEEGSTLYTEHTLYGQSIQQASRQSKRPGFQSNELPKGTSANSVYTQAGQLDTFEELLGTRKMAYRYIQQNSYLARGHLSPDADFLFAPLQFATYFYINTCPQWSNINSGNWKSLESMIRRVAGKHGRPLQIITGTHGILELPDANGDLTNIYLDRRGLLPVPKFIWKIVYSESSKQGIAFVSINNPFINSVTDDLILCKDICSRYNWVSGKWDAPDRGYIYCCDIGELQRVVPSVPRISVVGVLRA